jgi:hypothetical protein
MLSYICVQLYMCAVCCMRSSICVQCARICSNICVQCAALGVIYVLEYGVVYVFLFAKNVEE